MCPGTWNVHPEVEEGRRKHLYLCYLMCTSNIWRQDVPSHPLKIVWCHWPPSSPFLPSALHRLEGGEQPCITPLGPHIWKQSQSWLSKSQWSGDPWADGAATGPEGSLLWNRGGQWMEGTEPMASLPAQWRGQMEGFLEEQNPESTFE